MPQLFSLLVSLSNWLRAHKSCSRELDIPSEESIIAAGRELIESTDSWQLKKTINNVKVVHKPATSTDGSWFCRISEHSPEEVTYDQLWDKMARNKAQNEKEYVNSTKLLTFSWRSFVHESFIPDLVKIKKLQEISPTAQIWNLYYKMPFPLSNRTFTALQVVDESARWIKAVTPFWHFTSSELLQSHCINPDWPLCPQRTSERWRGWCAGPLCRRGADKATR